MENCFSLKDVIVLFRYFFEIGSDSIYRAPAGIRTAVPSPTYPPLPPSMQKTELQLERLLARKLTYAQISSPCLNFS